MTASPSKARRRMCFLFIILFMAFGFLLAVPAPDADETLSKVGSHSEEVRQIQQKLKSWGYYSGDADGIFGMETKKAVLSFQRKNGLTADGIAGPATLRAMGLSDHAQTSGGAYSQNDVDLLANIISAEARGEPCWGCCTEPGISSILP